MKKKIIIISIVVVLIIALGIIVIFALPKDNLALKESNFIFELGDEVPFEVSYYLDVNNEKYLSNSKIRFKYEYLVDTTDNQITSLNSEYLAVGEYELYIEYNDIKYPFVIEVRDTTKPEFIDFQETIVLEQDAVDVDLADYFNANDLSSVTIVVESDLDISVAGEYSATIRAEDYYHNITEKEATIIVKAKENEQDEPEVNPPEEEEPPENTNETVENNNTAPEVSNEEPEVVSATYRTDISDQLVKTINEYRISMGLPELPVTTEAQIEADRRAKEIVSNFSHDGSSNGFGENIGMGEINTDFFTLWKNSFSHNNAMLREQNTAIAVSIYQEGNMWYAVTVFRMNY